jgi:hypothetical protein
MDERYVPKLAIQYSVELVKELFYELKLTSFQILSAEDKRRLVMFRSIGHEEEYSMSMEHHKMIKVDEQVFEWSDEWDNYKIVLVNYDHESIVHPDGKSFGYDRPKHTQRECPICGGGGCIHCSPSWFV